MKKFWILLIGVMLLLVFPVSSLGTVTVQPILQNHSAVLKKLLRAQVIYLGETHDHAADHEAQLQIVKQLYRHQPKLTLALEMFQKPYQTSLDQYLKGQLTEAELLAQTEYPKRWGFNWDFYAPLLRFAKANQIPILALNTPSEVTRQVARAGLESLTPDDWAWIPPRSEIDLGNAAYRQRLEEIYGAFPHGHGNSGGFEFFVQAQILWDETMAATIAQSWRNHPDRTIIVLVGQGHLLYGDGIPSRVKRRLQSVSNWQQQSVLINPAPDLQLPQSRPVADAFWFTAQPTAPK